MEERLYPDGALVRSGALVTCGSEIPGVRISEIAPLTQIEAAVTRKRPGFADDRALVPEEIHSVPVKLTMMDGRITHDTR